jgi:uncharacterized cupredoxin-like copper-binding protein
MSRHLTRLVASTLILVFALIVAACGQETTATTNSETTETEFAFGSPADPSDADRVIEIQTTDALAFEPSDLTVSSGETVTFRLTNNGAAVHDFTLGDQAAQDEHEAEMSEMGGMVHDEPNVATIPAGETVELAWTFGEEGVVLIGCHQPGHYAAGMTGQITVEG